MPRLLLLQGSARDMLTEQGGRARERACPLEVGLNSSCSVTLDQSLSSNDILTIVFSKRFHLKPPCYVFPIFQRRPGGVERDRGQPRAWLLRAGPDLEPKVLPWLPPLPHPPCSQDLAGFQVEPSSLRGNISSSFSRCVEDAATYMMRSRRPPADRPPPLPKSLSAVSPPVPNRPGSPQQTLVGRWGQRV